MMTPADSKGNALKKKNESGVIVRGELQKSGMYKKWIAKTQNRIPAVGEKEVPRAPPNRKRSRLSSHSDEEASDGEETFIPRESDRGTLEAIQKGYKMTHKQQRKATKLKKLMAGSVTRTKRGSGGYRATELKTPQQIGKDKKKQSWEKIKQNPRKRQEEAKKSKEAYMQKQRKKAVARGAPTRSLEIRNVNSSKRRKTKR